MASWCGAQVERDDSRTWGTGSSRSTYATKTERGIVSGGTGSAPALTATGVEAPAIGSTRPRSVFGRVLFLRLLALAAAGLVALMVGLMINALLNWNAP